MTGFALEGLGCSGPEVYEAENTQNASDKEFSSSHSWFCFSGCISLQQLFILSVLPKFCASDKLILAMNSLGTMVSIF